MCYTTSLRRQHDTMLSLASDLHGKLDGIEDFGDAAWALRQLARITGLLKFHLAAENGALYPRLMASPDRATAAMASRYHTEIGVIERAYSAYVSKWGSSSAILTDLEGFRRDTRAIFAALAQRIERETHEFYPVVDAVHAVPERRAFG